MRRLRPQGEGYVDVDGFDTDRAIGWEVEISDIGVAVNHKAHFNVRQGDLGIGFLPVASMSMVTLPARDSQTERSHSMVQKMSQMLPLVEYNSPPTKASDHRVHEIRCQGF